MSKETLLQLVERLREAGQMDHLSFCNKYGSRPPWDHCNCIASDHNSAVDAAAKALVAEIEGKPEAPWVPPICRCGHSMLHHIKTITGYICQDCSACIDGEPV